MSDAQGNEKGGIEEVPKKKRKKSKKYLYEYSSISKYDNETS